MATLTRIPNDIILSYMKEKRTIDPASLRRERLVILVTADEKDRIDALASSNGYVVPSPTEYRKSQRAEFLRDLILKKVETWEKRSKAKQTSKDAS